MRKTYLLFLTSFIAAASFGQTFQRMVFNSTGGTIGENGSPGMILSIGEPVIGIAWTPGMGLAQGFLGGSKTVAPSTTGIEAVDMENAIVYPNPFYSYIKINSDLDNIHVSVYNTVGQQVYEGAYQSTGIDLSPLAPGIYVIQASSNQKSILNTKILKL